MIRSNRSRWIGGIGAVLLTGGMLVASAGLGVTSAVAQLVPPRDPHEGLPKNWSEFNVGPNRFVRVLTNRVGFEGLLDNETGLVWEKGPFSTPVSWVSAIIECTSRTTGDRKGWRLPSVHELASLLTGGFPALPSNHRFSNVQSAYYWSATTFAGNPTLAWSVHFGDGSVNPNFKELNGFIWCVRGGMNADAY